MYLFGPEISWICFLYCFVLNLLSSFTKINCEINTFPHEIFFLSVLTERNNLLILNNWSKQPAVSFQLLLSCYYWVNRFVQRKRRKSLSVTFEQYGVLELVETMWHKIWSKTFLNSSIYRSTLGSFEIVRVVVTPFFRENKAPQGRLGR